jgi:hypothetical protein
VAAARQDQVEVQNVSLASLPALLGQWSDDDFLRARAQRDPRLSAAVEQRAKGAQRTAAEAEMLASLLKPQPAAKSAVKNNLVPGQPGAPAPPSAELIRAVTTALGANDTELAREVLAQLLGGENSPCDALPPRERQAAVEGALGALLREGSLESEQLVLSHFSAPLPVAAVQPEPGKPAPVTLPPGEIAALRGCASARFRRLLARAMIEGAVPAGRREPLWPLLREPNPWNLEAQVVFCQSELADAPTRAELEKRFAGDSSESLKSSFGFTPQKTAAPASRPDFQVCVGRQLWGPPLTDFLALEQQSLSTLADAPAVLVLAATIPSNAVRSRLRQTLNRHWSEGPQAVRAGGVPGNILAEPGLIAVLKSLARENRTDKPVKPSAGKNYNHSRSHAHPARPQPAEKLKSNPASGWSKLTEDLVQGYCQFCYAGALARAAYSSGDAPAAENRAARQPLAPHPNSTVAAAYHIDWPGKRLAELPQLADDALQLDYQRIEERVKPSRPLAYYRRQLKHFVEHKLPNGLWLDALSEDAGEGRLRSIDVLISSVGAGPPATGDEEQQLTVQILFIEVQKPRE